MTESYVLTLKLNTSPEQDVWLSHTFWCGQQIYNVLVRHCKKQLRKLIQDPEYRDLLVARKESGLSKADKNRINQELADIRIGYGLSEYQLHAYVSVQQHRYKKSIDSDVAQKIASSVWRSVEKYLFDNGKCIHFRKYDEFESMEGKKNTSGMRFKDGRLHWRGQVIQPQIRTDYDRKALKSRVKYCRIQRKPVGTKYHYYLQLVLEGKPPVKHPVGHGTAGLDIGISTAAIVTKDSCKLTVLSSDAKDHSAQIRRTQRAMDRSRRITNPPPYLPDRTVRKGARKWIRSKHYRKLQFRKKSMERRHADAINTGHHRLANEIASKADTAYVEKMFFHGLARRSKSATKKADGRFRSRKRFGKSIGNHAPAAFLKILESRLASSGGELIKIDTVSFRASQYNHVTDDYVRKKLSCRGSFVGSRYVQRDLYSAFLLKNSNDTGTAADRQKCIDTFPMFLITHNACMDALLAENKKYPSSFGLRSYKYHKRNC
ncbi:transposase [Clostridium sp. AF34-10BH]|uniref:transposase n=1 Tax=Clostridium sp. AF34-10BH TaxID=2293011 RepID=UPI000E476274|nr:transposase [Clostridium sp. AF34-10BH]RHP33004.1 transposase [Clostridium sp. AF34-10BH]